MITREEAQGIAEAVVKQCRIDIDAEIAKLHKADNDNAWTEERATDIAKKAAALAVKQITDDFYVGVGKKTIAAIGAAVVASVILARDYIKTLVGLK